MTGGPAFGADIGAVFDGADITLLAATAGIVAVLLLITYRSPWLWLVPLTVVGLGDQVAAKLLRRSSRRVTDLRADGAVTGIISVLVFGAGTNYALLLIARYREELRHVVFNLARALERAERQEERAAVIGAWATIDGEDAKGQTELGLAEAAVDEHAAAERALRAAIRLDPTPGRRLSGARPAAGNLNRVDELTALAEEAVEAGLGAALPQGLGAAAAGPASRRRSRGRGDPRTINPVRRAQLIADIADRLGQTAAPSQRSRR